MQLSNTLDACFGCHRFALPFFLSLLDLQSLDRIKKKYNVE